MEKVKMEERGGERGGRGVESGCGRGAAIAAAHGGRRGGGGGAAGCPRRRAPWAKEGLRAHASGGAWARRGRAQRVRGRPQQLA